MDLTQRKPKQSERRRVLDVQRRTVTILVLMGLVSCSWFSTPRGAQKNVGHEGGELSATLENRVSVRLEIPPGAVPRETPFTIRLLKPDNAGLGDGQGVFGGRVLELGPDGARFARPLSLTISDPSGAPGSLEGYALFYHDEELRAWEPLVPSNTERENNSATYRLEHFSKYAVVETNLRVDAVALIDPVTPGDAYRLRVTATHLNRQLQNSQLPYHNYNKTISISVFHRSTTGDVERAESISPGTSKTWDVSFIGGEAGSLDRLEVRTTVANAADPDFIVYRQYFVSDLTKPTNAIEAETLLRQYAPVLEFAKDEIYRPTSILHVLDKASAFAIRSPYIDASPDVEDIGRYDPGMAPQASRQALLANYGNAFSRIEFEGNADQFKFDQLPVNAYTVYGRVVEIDDDTRLLSYFLFFPYDPKSNWVADKLAGHDGDRESITIEVNRGSGSWLPTRVAFGQHRREDIMVDNWGSSRYVVWQGDVLTLPWEHVDRHDQRPIVYVAEGSHALYPRASDNTGVCPKSLAFSYCVVRWYSNTPRIPPLSLEPAGGDKNSRLWPDAAVGRSEAKYKLETLPSMRDVVSGHPYGWLLYSGYWVSSGERIFPFIDRWYKAKRWMDDGWKWQTTSIPFYQCPDNLGECRPYLGLNRYSEGLASSSGISFSDVRDTDWFFDYVRHLALKGVVANNVPTFRPADSVNRAEFLKMVTLGADGRIQNVVKVDTVEEFTDVDRSNRDHWFADFVLIALQNDIIDAASVENNYLFRPGDNLTRAEAAKLIARAYHLPVPAYSDPPFPDVPLGQWYTDPVAALKAMDIIQGYVDDGGKFRPLGNINRAEATKMISLASERAPLP